MRYGVLVCSMLFVILAALLRHVPWSELPILTPSTSAEKRGVASSEAELQNAPAGAAATPFTLQENKLTPANVSEKSFGRLFSRPVDGQMYARPVYVPHVKMKDGREHNVIVAATMHNSVYAFDADDSKAEQPLWRINHGHPRKIGWGYGSTKYRDIAKEVGILSTPAVDLKEGMIYSVALIAKGHRFFSWKYHYEIHKNRLSDGSEASPPVVIEGALSGDGPGSADGKIRFNPEIQLQRPALFLLGGAVHVAFGSMGDGHTFNGWIFSYDLATLKGGPSFLAIPDADSSKEKDQGGGGIWQSGQAPAIDDQGFIYLSTGNGSFNLDKGGNNCGDCVMKLRFADGKFTRVDWFSPYDTHVLDEADMDIGVAAPILIPPSAKYPGAPTLVIAGSKDGKFYVLDGTGERGGLGGYNPKGDTQIFQSFRVTDPKKPNRNIHGAPIYWEFKDALRGGRRGCLYVMAEEDYLKCYERDGETHFIESPAVESTSRANDGMPGGFLTLTANGDDPSSGIIWVTHSFKGDANQKTRPGILRAFDASDLRRELWNSRMNAGRDDFGSFAKFSPPVAADGKICIGTFSGHLDCYGLLQEQPQ